MTTTLNPDDRARLREFLEQRFSLEELETLAFDLGIDYDKLPHTTTTQLSMELIGYFERRDNLYLLLNKVLSLRYDRHLAQLSARFPRHSPRKKVQVIVHQDLLEDPDELIADISARLKIGIDQVEILAVARGSLRLLIGLPQDAADLLVTSKIHDFVNGKYQVISITAFDSMDKASQEAWRTLVRKAARQPVQWKNVLPSSGSNPSEQLLRILVIEDDLNWREQFRDILESMGFEVDPVESARGAEALLRRGDYVLVLLDLALDQQDYNLRCQLFCESLHTSYPNLPLVAATGKALSLAQIGTLFQFGVAGFISKPDIQLERFRQTIQAALRVRSNSNPPYHGPVPQKVVDASMVEAVKLRQVMEKAYDIPDLKILCHDMNVIFGNVQGENLSTTIVNLINYFQHHNRSGELVEKVRSDRPRWANQL